MKMRMADGREFMIAKKRKRRKTDESASTAVAEPEEEEGEVVIGGSSGGQFVAKKGDVAREVGASPAPHQSTVDTDKLLATAGKGALGVVAVGVVIYKKIKTGTWIDWAMQKYDDAGSRRTAVQDESQLGELNMLSCTNCGYTIFPALGRTFRFDLYTQKCANCGMKGTFYDKNDPNDERNIKEDGTNTALEQRDYMKDWIKADKKQAKKITAELAKGVEKIEKKGKAVPTALKVDMKDKEKERREDAIEAAEAAAEAAVAGGAEAEQDTRGATTVVSLGDDGELTSGGAADGRLVDMAPDDNEEEGKMEGGGEDDGKKDQGGGGGSLDLLG